MNIINIGGMLVEVVQERLAQRALHAAEQLVQVLGAERDCALADALLAFSDREAIDRRIAAAVRGEEVALKSW